MSQLVPFLDVVEHQWADLSRELSPVVRTLDVRRDLEQGKLSIELEWPAHLAAIQAWEHAMSLDIDVLDVRSKQGTMFVSGRCEDQGQASERLHRFRSHILATLA